MIMPRFRAIKECGKEGHEVNVLSFDEGGKLVKETGIGGLSGEAFGRLNSRAGVGKIVDKLFFRQCVGRELEVSKGGEKTGAEADSTGLTYAWRTDKNSVEIGKEGLALN